MNIERHNYEEFFLLYADNELCAADRKAVEMFVTKNPDLKKELQLLLQTVFIADAEVFENKAALLKEEITPLQKQLLLFIDGELSADDKVKLQQLINTNKAAAKEFALLRQTILQPDTAIIFANINILYKKEEGRVLRIGWLRVAAAAVLLGFGTWATLTFIKPAQQTTAGAVAENGNIVKPAIETNSNTNTVVVPQLQTPVIANDIITQAPATKQTEAKKNKTVTPNKIQQNLPQQTNDNSSVAKSADKPSNNLPQPLYNNINNNSSNQTAIANVPSIDNATDKVNSGKAELVASSTKPNTEAVKSYAINASFKTDNTIEEEENLEEEKTKRTKIGGLIRKVKRLVERNTNTKVSNSIKVAGFEIALNK